MRILLVLLLLCGGLAAHAADRDTIQFWDQPRHGGNSFNRLPPDQAYFDALHTYGASWVRLAYDKWKPQQRDFLLGNADHYQSLDRADLQTLKATLARAHQAGLKVVIAPLSLPYSRWSQNNGGRFDDRLWESRAHWQDAARFWRDLAAQLKDDPSVAAYNIVNEPAPEKRAGLAEHANAAVMTRWSAQHHDDARDLPAFYAQVIKAIREVDPNTPIMLDAGWYGAADGFAYWQAPLPDERVLYSFHMYEPYAATSGPNLKRATPYHYPGDVPYGGKNVLWDADRVARYLAQPLAWAQAHGVPATRMVAGEFGCVRMLDNCTRYLEDVLKVFDRQGIHWAFYSFREDSWDAMDYELGKKKVPWAYWQAMEQNKPDPLKRSATPEFEPIRRRLAQDR